LQGKFHRDSLNTCDLAVAVKQIQDTELDKPKAPAPKTLEAAYQRYTMILKAQRGVKENSIENVQEAVFNRGI